MIELLKKYWDMIGGALAGILLTILAEFETEKIQLYSSIIILVLVSIGALRLVKQEIAARGQKDRKHNIVDSIIDGQNSIKAISLAQEPTQEGEKVGNLIIKLMEDKKIMEKLKTFFSKFKGYMLTIALTVLSIIEMCGGFINSLFGGVLTIKGIAVLPVVTMICAAVVGILSNGYTKEQMKAIKAIVNSAKTNSAKTNGLVKEEIKKNITEKKAERTKYTKQLTQIENNIVNLEKESESLKNTLQAKKEMYAMTPQLASENDVKLAANAVEECANKINAEKAEKLKVKTLIENLTTTIEALKSQL